MPDCGHDPHDVVFYGVVNLNYEGKIAGSLDIWICKRCRDMFFEEKRFIDTKPTTDLGFRGAGDGFKWGVLVCYNRNELNWVVLSVKPGQNLEHKCLIETAPQVSIGPDWKVANPNSAGITHKVILVEQHINKAVEITEA